jgi:hypothetical protein
MFEDTVLSFAGAGVVAFLIASAWSPIGLLSWWAGHGRPARAEALDSRSADVAAQYVVYLGGIDSIDGDRHSDREVRFLDGLKRQIPHSRIVGSVFPYAASGEPLLTGPRVFRWLWRAIANIPDGAKRPARAYIVNIRNLFQVLVAADRRYGPIFQVAMSDVIMQAIAASGWRHGSNSEVCIIGYSGGAQMALAAAGHMAAQIDGPLRLIAIGGTILSTRGVEGASRLAYLYGGRDIVPRMAAAASMDRWSINPLSAWRAAVRDGRIVRTHLAGMRHLGAMGYLGDAILNVGGSPNWQLTLEAVVKELQGPIRRIPSRDNPVVDGLSA